MTACNTACPHRCLGLKNGDKRWVDGILVTCDVSKDGKTAKKKQTSGLTSGDPADSCKAIKAGGGTKDGEYFVKSAGGGTLKVYCDLTTNGGGWTMVVKVSNHDAGNFYCKGSNGPLQRGVDINTNEQSTLKKVDVSIGIGMCRPAPPCTFCVTSRLRTRPTRRRRRRHRR